MNFRKSLWFHLGSKKPYDNTMLSRGRDQKSVDNIIILPNWLPVLAAATREHLSNVTQRRRIMETFARNFWGLTPVLITTNSSFCVQIPTFTELGSYPARSNKLVMPPCCRTKGTPLSCLSDLQPVAFKRQSIASVGIYVDLRAVIGRQFKQYYMTR